MESMLMLAQGSVLAYNSAAALLRDGPVLAAARVERRLNAARVLVNTSRYEGMPNKFLQGWARGVPTVATVDMGRAAHRRFAALDAGVREIEALFEDQVLWERASRRFDRLAA